MNQILGFIICFISFVFAVSCCFFIAFWMDNKLRCKKCCIEWKDIYKEKPKSNEEVLFVIGDGIERGRMTDPDGTGDPRKFEWDTGDNCYLMQYEYDEDDESSLIRYWAKMPNFPGQSKKRKVE